MIRWGLVLLWLLAAASLAGQGHGNQTRASESTALELLRARFDYADVRYPPERIQLIALKESRELELWAWQERRWRHVHDYPVFAASGHAGPKLREGDKQVPEGFYRIESLNPNSRFHLSLKLDYPNLYDWKNALDEGRTNPGSNIFIHGSAWSVGCLAVGNRSIEEIYRLVSDIGVDKAHLLIAPYDLRVERAQVRGTQPQWVKRLYALLKLRMQAFPLAEKQVACSVECLLERSEVTYKDSPREFD